MSTRIDNLQLPVAENEFKSSVKLAPKNLCILVYSTKKWLISDYT